MGVHDVEATNKAKELLGIPEDEPVFILRGQDALAAPTIARYRNSADGVSEREGKRPKAAWFREMDTVIADFTRFAVSNPDRMKVPD